LKLKITLALLGALSCLVLSAAAQTPTAKERDATVDLAAKLKEVEANPALLDAARKSGAKVAQFCANCHGEGGNSNIADTPNLAGQNSAYLLEQVRRFSDGRRKNEFMEGMIKALKADEKIGITV
jgi:cytochrome c553